MCCSSTMSMNEHCTDSGMKKKEQISKNSFVCTLNVNGKNSILFAYFTEFLFFCFCSFFFVMFTFTENVFVWRGKHNHRESLWLSTAMRMKWVVVNEMEVCTSYLANGMVRTAERNDSYHNPWDELEHIFTKVNTIQTATRYISVLGYTAYIIISGIHARAHTHTYATCKRFNVQNVLCR